MDEGRRAANFHKRVTLRHGCFKVWRNGCVWCCITSRSFIFAVVSWSNHLCLGSNRVVGAHTVSGRDLGYLKKGAEKERHWGRYGLWAYNWVQHVVGGRQRECVQAVWLDVHGPYGLHAVTSPIRGVVSVNVASHFAA